jgi:predicted DNA-binding protein (UPF0251 family)
VSAVLLSAVTAEVRHLPQVPPWEWGRDPELCLYRDRTIAILRRFLRLSLDTGRLPSLLGRQFFRAKVTSYRIVTFEDAVIFVHDIEKCLEQLDDFSQNVIARVVLQEYTQEEAARLLHRNRKTVRRKLQEALDHLSEIFILTGLLRPMQKRPH